MSLGAACDAAEHVPGRPFLSRGGKRPRQNLTRPSRTSRREQSQLRFATSTPHPVHLRQDAASCMTMYHLRPARLPQTQRAVDRAILHP